jgi:hypothetical protein
MLESSGFKCLALTSDARRHLLCFALTINGSVYIRITSSE